VKQDHPRQTRDIGQDTLQDPPQEALDRISVAQAANRLGITQDAVRKRIARGTIRHEKDHEGRIFVYLDTFEREYETDQDNGQGAESKTVLDDDQDKYTRSLEDQIGFLRRELERKDTIIMSLTQRIPELEASPEPREGHGTPSEEADESTAPQEQQQEPSQRRSWLYRFFFGP
jgi:predicted RNase H-like nuclease (RuvC/YqgF family)